MSQMNAYAPYIGGAVGAIQFGTGLYATLQQNQRIEDALQTLRDNTVREQQSLSESYGRQIGVVGEREAEIVGTLRALSGSGSAAGTLISQAAARASKAKQATQVEFARRIDALRRGYRQGAAQLSGQYVSPFLAGVTGAIDGAVTGLGAAENLTTPDYRTGVPGVPAGSGFGPDAPLPPFPSSPNVRY